MTKHEQNTKNVAGKATKIFQIMKDFDANLESTMKKTTVIQQ